MPKKYRNNFPFKSFEDYPLLNQKNQLLFLTRLWAPYDKKGNFNAQIDQINKKRIKYIQLCRKEFGKYFIGGLSDTTISRQEARELILEKEYTSRYHFIKSVKNSNICISTTGLHHSMGWKFSEYIAASRAISSEPLHYLLPGDFGEKNYIEFTSEDKLINGIIDLIRNKEKMISIMHNNYIYYNNYVRPDNLVLNSILEVFKYI